MRGFEYGGVSTVPNGYTRHREGRSTYQFTFSTLLASLEKDEWLMKGVT